jgi:septum formation protein
MRRVLVLASASPRRRELLRWLAADFALESPTIDENPGPGESAPRLVSRLALAKAAAVAARRPADWVLGADTIVEIDGLPLGKPSGAAEAAVMIAQLAGREHRVATGFALLAPGGEVHADEVVITRVRFRALGPGAIAAYTASGESEDKAGGYAIQGLGAGLIDRIDGSFTNVIGLPLVEVGRALARAGLLA